MRKNSKTKIKKILSVVLSTAMVLTMQQFNFNGSTILGTTSKHVSAASDISTYGKSDSTVTASYVAESGMSASDGYFEYDIKVANGSTSTVNDWVAVATISSSVTGTKTSSWSSWSGVNCIADGTTLYIYPNTSAKSATVSVGSSETYSKIGFTASANQGISGITVYYSTTASAFSEFISSVGGSSSGSGDSTTDLNLDVEYNYAKLLEYSLYLYDANMCGSDVGEECGLDWRDDCHTVDTTATYNGKTVDVSGGFHDAGDHAKFGLPQGYSATILGIGYYEYKDAYTQTGTASHLKKITGRFCDYFKRCTVLDSSGNVEAFCYQVGDGDSDHSYWGAPEKQTTERKAFFATTSNPATDEVSEAIAALTMQYLNFGDTECLSYAKKLFAFEKGISSKSVTTNGPGSFYSSQSWADDYCLAAALLYKATSDSTYQTEFNSYKDKLGIYSWPSWDNVSTYAYAYGTGDYSAFKTNVDSTKGSSIVDNGYVAISEWGSARYNCNMQLEGLIYDKNTSSSTYTAWATGQMKFLLGNNSTKRCYVVGYNANSSKYPHHRASSGFSDVSSNGTTTQAHVLVGALVGGMMPNGTYEDNASNYYCNEVAIDYNAAFVGAAAALYLNNSKDGEQYVIEPSEISGVKSTEKLDSTCTVTIKSADGTATTLPSVSETPSTSPSALPSESPSAPSSESPSAPSSASPSAPSSASPSAGVQTTQPASTTKPSSTPVATIASSSSQSSGSDSSVSGNTGNSQTDTQVGTTITKIKIIGKNKVKKGKKLKLKIKAFDAQGNVVSTSGIKFTWKSSSKKIAKVNKKGKLKAIKRGKVKITCKSSTGIKAIKKIKVK